MDFDKAFNWKPKNIGTPYENFKSRFPSLDYSKLIRNQSKLFTDDYTLHYIYDINNQDLLYLMYGNNKEMFDNTKDNNTTQIEIEMDRSDNSWKISNMI